MEQTAEVIDGPQSIVFDQAENRMHMHKSLMLILLRAAYKIMVEASPHDDRASRDILIE